MQLQKCLSMKYLGVIIETKLNWINPLTYVKNKNYQRNWNYQKGQTIVN